MYGLGVSAQQHNIDTQKSTLTIHVGKTGVFSGLGHEHEVRAPIHSGTADTGSHPAVEVHVDARELRVSSPATPKSSRGVVLASVSLPPRKQRCPSPVDGFHAEMSFALEAK